MRKDSWFVKPDDARPAGAPGQCFYCNEPMGTEHKAGCVIRTRTVVITATFTIIKKVPEDWEPSMIEFHLNESSSCADNVLHDINKLTSDDRCLCSQFEGRYVREATAEDLIELE